MNQDVFARYQAWLVEVDRRCAALVREYRGDLRCRKGCDICCTGVPVTALEQAWLAEGIRRSGDRDLQARLAAQDQAGFTGRPVQGPQDQAAPGRTGGEDPEYRCVYLSAPSQGHCLVYPWRPLICRVHGLPLVYPVAEYDQWGRRTDTPETREYQLTACDLNFQGLDEAALLERGFLSMEELQHTLDGLDQEWQQSGEIKDQL